jgi:hypothetical protein
MGVPSRFAIRGFSRGVPAPAAWMRAARVVLQLHNKWDDAVFSRRLARGPIPLAQMKATAAPFHARYGECKIAGSIHLGFDWGLSLACTKEDVEMILSTAPTDPSQIAGITLRPRTGAAPRCE